MTDFLSIVDSTENKEPADQGFIQHTADSLRYNLFQAPLNGVAQLLDRAHGRSPDEYKILPSVQFCEPPKPSEFGTSSWAGDLVGGTAATVIQFGALHRFVGAGAAAKAELSPVYGLRTAMPGIGRSVFTGMIVGGVFTPSDDSAGNFANQRLASAGISGLNFGLMTAGSVWLKTRGSTFLANDIVANSLAGVPAGVLHADLHSLAHKGEMASWRERGESVTNYALGGAMAGGMNILHENIRPTSGMQGVRTIDDIRSQADKTINLNRPPKQQEIVYRLPNAEQLLAEGSPDNWHERTALAIRAELDHTPLSVEQKKVLVTEHLALALGLEALNNRPDPKPIMTLYGSARLGKNSQAGQEARWIAGLAGQKGYDVMTGGAPSTTPYDGGLMGMASKGASEAGTNVIGVTIKLPFEAADTPDVYHTMTIQCRNFPSRMILLRQVDKHDPARPADAPIPVKDRGFFVVGEAGIGTLAEFYDLVTQMQTGKIPRRPVYLRGETAEDVMRTSDGQLGRKTISDKDLHLFKVIRDPRQMFEDVPKWQAQIAAEEAAEAVYREGGLHSPERASAHQKQEALQRYFNLPAADHSHLQQLLSAEVQQRIKAMEAPRADGILPRLDLGREPLLQTFAGAIAAESAAILKPPPASGESPKR